MISFADLEDQVVLVYGPDDWAPASWVNNSLSTHGVVTLSRVFTVRKEDLVDTTTARGDAEGEEFEFVIGDVFDGYRRIRADVLGLKHDLLITKRIQLERKIFVAELSISIFRQMDELIDEQIVVGGERENSVPELEFRRLLWDFPTTTELKHYTRLRITRVLREYLETLSDAELRLTKYMERRSRSGPRSPVRVHERIPAASALELEKFTYVRDRLAEMLKDSESYTEAIWQETVADLFLLIFPQYVAVLHKVRVNDQYSTESKAIHREIDLMLVAANGCVDIIEIKKPFQRSLVSRRQYRDNHVPIRELSGSIIQVEKYLFHLGKSGRRGERELTAKHAADIPAGLELRIVNPKGIILSGRDVDLTDKEKFDFEFARRSYANVIDIISYDDLLRRLDNVIAVLTKRVATADAGLETSDE
jgi:hypothetical protein